MGLYPLYIRMCARQLGSFDTAVGRHDIPNPTHYYTLFYSPITGTWELSAAHEIPAAYPHFPYGRPVEPDELP